MVWLARFEGRRCVLSFEDPLAMETVRIDGRIYPLAADFTVPLAVALARTNPKKFELTRMLNPAKYAETARIARLQPYDLNKTGALLAVHMDADLRRGLGGPGASPTDRHLGILLRMDAWTHGMPDLPSAFYFSAVAYTTTGYGDLVLPKEWRLVGGVEALTGILMCGLSTRLFSLSSAKSLA